MSRETPEECHRRLLSEDAHREAEADDGRWRELSDREWEALSLCAQGLRIHDIAERMHVSDSAVKTYLLRMRGKLGAADTDDAVRRFRAWRATWAGHADPAASAKERP